MRKIISTLILGFGIPSIVFGVDPLLPSRTPAGQGSWSGLVGVPGNIPNRTFICATLNSGASESAVASAIDACSANSAARAAGGGVVKLNAGTYNWPSGLYIYDSHVTLRGSGAENTIINGTIEIGDWRNWWNLLQDGNTQNAHHVAWTGGLTQGQTQITIANSAGYAVGQLIALDQLNSLDIPNDDNATMEGDEGVTPYTYWSVNYPIDGRDRALHQLNRISSCGATTPGAACTSNTITLTEPVYTTFNASKSPEVWTVSAQPTEYSGVEDVRINGRFSPSFSYGIWLKNCIVSGPGGDNLGYVYLQLLLRSSIVNNVLTSSSYSEYGIESRFSSGLLVQNNITDRTGAAIQPNGVSGSVYAYNFITNVISGSPGMSAGFIQHGGFPWMNLFEGNYVPEIAMDNTDSIAYMNTMVRNRALATVPMGTYQGGSVPAWSNIQAIYIGGMNRNMTVVGNVLGTSAISFQAYQDGPTCDSGSDRKRVYAIGYWHAECSDRNLNFSPRIVPYDNKTKDTLIRWGNQDVVTDSQDGAGNGIKWDPAELNGFFGATAPTQNIPSSYYLTSKPAWWPAGLRYPAFGPDPDAPSTLLNGKNPAQVCYEASPTNMGTISQCLKTEISVPATVPHPADTNTNYLMELNEATTFGACWKTSCSANATLDNASRAGFLWKGSGAGAYQYNSATACPLCWEVKP